jgi:hypothetical protein
VVIVSYTSNRGGWRWWKALSKAAADDAEEDGQGELHLERMASFEDRQIVEDCGEEQRDASSGTSGLL